LPGQASRPLLSLKLAHALVVTFIGSLLGQLLAHHPLVAQLGPGLHRRRGAPENKGSD